MFPTQSLTLLRWILPLLVALSPGSCLVGCASLNPQPPIEAFANKLADEAIIPAVREGLTQGVEQLSIQAGAQGINPTYAVNFEGKWVVGIEGRATVGVEGVAGQLQVSSTSNEETETSPHAQDKGDGEPLSRQRGEANAADGTLDESGSAVAVPPTVSVYIDDVDADEDKGFGRLADGALVVVLGAADKLGQTVNANVTAIVATRGGRVITARLASSH